MKERTKDIQIGSRTFQVGSFTPRDGAWIAAQFYGRVLPPALSEERDADEKHLGLALSGGLADLVEPTFNRVQAHCFAVTMEYNSQKIAMPVMMRDGPRKGEWAGEPLSIVDSFALMLSALIFNLYDFFDKGAREKLLTVLPDLSRISTPTSSAQ